MYKCKPERNPRQAYIIIFGCALILIAIGIASAVVPVYKIVFHLMFLFGLTFAFFIAYRYTMTEMVYAVDGDSFTITKTVGKKTVTVCSLDLSTAKAFMDEKEYRANKKTLGYIDKKYNYTQNICGSYRYYICEFNGLTLLVKFEPNDIFAAKMEQSIYDSKNGGGEADAEEGVAD